MPIHPRGPLAPYRILRYPLDRPDRGADGPRKGLSWDCNQTALHVTAEGGAIELTRILLDAGADPDIRDDKYQSTVLGWAEFCGQPEIAALLRQRGATG